MNLTIDIGNTRIKSALFAENKLQILKTHDSFELLLADTAFILKAKKAIICSVVNNLEFYIERLNQKIPTYIFQSDTQIPIRNLYLSAETLGSDRLATAIGGFYL